MLWNLTTELAKEQDMATVEVRNIKTLGAIIRAARLNSDITVTDFSERVNLTPQYLWQLETGKSNLFITRLFRVLRRLNITVTVTFPDREQDDA